MRVIFFKKRDEGVLKEEVIRDKKFVAIIKIVKDTLVFYFVVF